MGKIYLTLFAVVGLSGCATLNNARVKAVNILCQNRDMLVAMALSSNDTATANAIDAYCPLDKAD